MPFIGPNSDIYFIRNLPIDSKYSNTYYFTSEAEQYNFFYNKTQSADRFSKVNYQRANKNTIKLAVPMSSALKYSYMMFKNTSYENKWFYAFVENVDYINQNCTLITYSIDYIQTFLKQFELLPCYIERQHTETDGIGDNIVAENFKIDDYREIFHNTKRFDTYSLVVIGTQGVLLDLANSISGGNANVIKGQRIGGSVIFADILTLDFSNSEIDDLREFLSALTSNLNSGKIVNMFLVPTPYMEKLFTLSDGKWVQSNANHNPSIMHTIDVSGGIDDRAENFNIKNNKLYTYPYNYIELTNYQGESKVIRYEYLGTLKSSLKLTEEISLGDKLCSYTYPTGYNNQAQAFEYGVQLNSFVNPIFSGEAWISLVDGIGSKALSLLPTLLAGVPIKFEEHKGIATFTTQGDNVEVLNENGGWQTIGKYENIVESNVEFSTPKLDFKAKPQAFPYVSPPQITTPSAVTNTDLKAGSLNFQWLGINGKRLNPFWLKRIDKYFTKYGYAINNIQKPNLYARERFTYIKTRGCELGGAIPNEFKRNIENIFDSGITFWRPTATIGDYNTNNNVL